MKIRNSILFFSLLGAAVLFICPLSAADKAGSMACVFLRDGQGARALGMGGAFTAVGMGMESLFWNPGGM
ncbi:MAG: hypothetical protein ABII27_00140, partial [bacterium]